MENKKVLIIDDDEKLNRLLTEYLSRYGFRIDSATSPSAAFAYIDRKPADIIILDIMLPEMDGFEVCKRIRAGHDIPIIMLTARGDVSDRIVGLELGADDYLPKPFEPRELVARIQTVLRRGVPPGKCRRERYGSLELDHRRYQAFKDGTGLDLTTMEFAILALLAGKAGSVVTRDEVFEKIKGIDSESFDRSIDVAVSRIRSKMGDDPKNPEYILTVRGAGYMFIGRRS
jgi:two-component system phosphate regulon response regulator OmpR